MFLNAFPFYITFFSLVGCLSVCLLHVCFTCFVLFCVFSVCPYFTFVSHNIDIGSRPLANEVFHTFTLWLPIFPFRVREKGFGGEGGS